MAKKNDRDSKRLVRNTKLMDRWDVSATLLYRLRRDQKLQHYVIGGRIYYTEQDIAEFLEKSKG